MADMNRVFLEGRLVKDPEVSYGKTSQIPVCTFNLASNRPKGKDGEDKGADFVPCKVFGKLAETMDRYSYKGQLVRVEGNIHTGKYERKDGTTAWTFDVYVKDVRFLSFKQREEVVAGKTERADARAVNEAMEMPSFDDYPVPEGFTRLEDDIPFK